MMSGYLRLYGLGQLGEDHYRWHVRNSIYYICPYWQEFKVVYALSPRMREEIDSLLAERGETDLALLFSLFAKRDV